MKKTTLLFLSLLVTGFGFAQNSMTEVYGASNPTNIVNPGVQLAPCNQNMPSNSLENGLFFGGATNQHLAIDIDVDPDTTFSIEEIIPTFADQQTTTSFIFYENDGDLPGAVIATVTDYTITNDVITGTNFGFDFHQYTFELTTPFELEGGATGAKYWMEIISDAVAWESTSAGVTGLAGAFNNDNTAGAWQLGTSEYVYDLNGDCSPTLGINDNLEASLVLYPNPASDILHIAVPANVEIINVQVYDLLGKRTNLELSNGTINTSNLARGMYILELNTSAGSVTKKIVKE